MTNSEIITENPGIWLMVSGQLDKYVYARSPAQERERDYNALASQQV